ncbi:MAG: hypothetical protein ACYSOF_00545 [Planctomycetota bacterium]|jgi:hypothetical protein
MEKLTPNQQQLILDFYFRCGDQKDIEAGRDLIAAMPEAAKLYSGLESTLTDLDHIKYDSCPDNLVDLTIARLKLMASSSKGSNAKLHQLLKKEQKFSPDAAQSIHPAINATAAHRKTSSLRPVFDFLAVAAGIALVAGILFPSFGLARQKYWQVSCQNNMRVVGAGFASLVGDTGQSSNSLSQVRVKAGAPWWRIGDQGQQVRSNTRYPFKLVQEGYVDSRAFLCKGDKVAKRFVAQVKDADQLHDFPSHKNLSYSFSLFCDNNADPLLCAKKIIASDLNPVFQKVRCEKTIYQGTDEFIKLQLNEQLKQSMSINHQGRGQNLLYGDGSVKYTRSRIVNGDDIYTVKGVDVYTGCETPVVSDDIFLVP